TGTSNGGACDGTDLCDGAGHCVDVFKPASAVCRASAGQCDVAESCTGTSSECPSDAFVPNGTTCTDGNACTLQDVCMDGQCVSGNGPNSEPGCVLDTGGSDDAPGQKDLTEFCQNLSSSCSGTILTWQWDDTGWTGSNT